MASKAIPPIVWNDIANQIASGHCVAFLGAGVNAKVDPEKTPGRPEYSGLPLGGEVASRLSASFVGGATDRRLEELVDVDGALKGVMDALLALVQDEQQRQDIARDYRDLFRLRLYDLPRVALHAEAQIQKAGVVGLVKAILVDDDVPPSLLLRTLARLPLRLIITTNYDRLMEKAYEVEGQPKPIVIPQRRTGFDSDESAEWNDTLQRVLPENLTPRKVAADGEPGEPAIVYKMHGTFGDDASGLVLSEDDYVDFMTTMSSSAGRGMPRLLSQMIVDSSLLLLGYSLEDWDFRTIYKALIEGQERDQLRMSYAIQYDPTPMWAEFWRQKAVRIFDYDLGVFADGLRDKFGLSDGDG